MSFRRIPYVNVPSGSIRRDWTDTDSLKIEAVNVTLNKTPVHCEPKHSLFLKVLTDSLGRMTELFPHLSRADSKFHTVPQFVLVFHFTKAN